MTEQTKPVSFTTSGPCPNCGSRKMRTVSETLWGQVVAEVHCRDCDQLQMVVLMDDWVRFGKPETREVRDWEVEEVTP